MIQKALLLILLFGFWCIPNLLNSAPANTNIKEFNCPIITSVTATPGSCSGSTYNLTVNISYTGGTNMIIQVDGVTKYNSTPTNQVIVSNLIGDGTSNVLVEVTISATSCSAAVGSNTYNEPNCSGGGSCMTNRTLSGTQTGTATFLASNTITSTQVINSGANITYGANNSVTLQAGFWAKAGSTFTASTNGCSPLGGDSESSLAQQETINVEAKRLNFEISPNPSSDVAVVAYEFPQNERIWLSVFNAEGKVVAQLLNGVTRNKGFYREEFTVSNLPAGNYFVALRTEKENLTKQLVITK